MKTDRVLHTEFWTALAGALGAAGTDLLTALDTAEATILGTALETLAADLRSELRDGATLGNAMMCTGECTPTMRALAAAGEAGGGLPTILERMAEAIQEGTLRVPGDNPPPGEDPVRLWRAVGGMLSAGIPLPRVLELLDDELQSAPLRNALAKTNRAMADGRAFGDALADQGTWFGSRVIAAVRAAEERGDLDVAAFDIADDVMRGDRAPVAAPEAREEEGEAESFVENLLARAIQGGVSDIHLEPTGEGNGRIRLRREDRLSLADAVPKDLFPRLIGRLKLLGSMDIAEQRRPQEGWIEGFKCDDRTFDLRIATVITNLGERLTVRLLNRGAAMAPLERLGFFPDDLERMRGFCARSHGLVIVAGPAGSGKTSVLYSMIREIDRDARCVVTIEDPVHFLLPGTSQIPCGADRGLAPVVALRTAMRQDPDVLVIGEFDDQETIREAHRAEKSGHLVLAQMHAEDAPGAVQGLLDYGIEAFRINASLTAAISLRVVRKLCLDCREEHDLDPDAWPEEVLEFLLEQESVMLHEATGCPNCGGTGYRGRAGIFEILVPDDAFRAVVSAETGRQGLAHAARAAGMRPMLESGLALAAEGATSVEEVVRGLQIRQ